VLGRLLFSCISILFLLGAACASTKRIVGYYYGKSSLAGYQFSEAPVEKLTHLIYSQAKPDSLGKCTLGHPDVDVTNLELLKGLRVRNPRLLILLSVGGWSGSTYFSDLASTAVARKNFSASCIELVERFGFDGLDIDWEYPVAGGKPTDHKRKSDKTNFVLLLEQLRGDLDTFGHGRHLLLTIASTCYRNHLADLSVKEMSDLLDWFNLMGYDLNEMEPNRTSHHSGLFASRMISRLDPAGGKFENDNAAVQWYLDQGVAPDKIVLGVPFYGQIWSNVSNRNDGLFQPYSGRLGDDGVLSFREIEASFLPTYSRHWDDEAKVPWLYNNKTKIMISYEDPESLRAKAQYVIGKNLGGMMFWDLAQDDSRSTLLNTLCEQLGH
jgi:chitinase